jgi:hypothetical protein
VAVLVGHLRREQELHLVVGSGEQEGREQGGDVELGVEAVCEHHDEAVARRLVKGREAGAIRGEVDREGRPLVPLPVFVERSERPRLFRELLDLHFPPVDVHASST